MGWVTVERKIGRAGSEKQRAARQRDWDQKYGEGEWTIGYIIDGEFVEQDAAITSVYNRSYAEYLDAHPEEVEFLQTTAKTLRNPHAEATTGVDLQVPAILEYLETRGLSLEGEEVVDIGTWKGQGSHAISTRLSPLQIPCCIAPKWTLEKFWQERKVLVVWRED